MRMHKYVCKYLYNHILVNVQVSAEHVYVPLFSLAYLIDCMHVRENKEHIPLLSCQYSGIILTKFLLTILLPSTALSKAQERALAFASITQKSPVRDAITPPPQGVGDGGKKKVQKYIASACFNILGP